MAEGDLQSEAAERRERLRALRAAVELVGPSEDPQVNEPHGEEEEKEKEPPLEEAVRFRNYVPRDKQFQSNKVPAPTIPKFEDPVAAAPVANGTEDPFVSIAPKKANWDLRRDVAKKMEKLERRTQRALIELLQEEEMRKQELVVEEPKEEGD